MCGIIGYTGNRHTVPLIMEALHSLAYRGYDSAGIGFVSGQQLHVVKAGGKLPLLEEQLSTAKTLPAQAGLGHLRWATHGAPNALNAHPHQDESGSLCIVHNGIIENYQEIKNTLQQKGIRFSSQTDTEVLANSIAEEKRTAGSFSQALANALEKVHGSYAVAVLCQEEPETIYAARHGAPLLLGLGSGENFLASDVAAFLPYTREVIFLEDGEIAKITPETWQVFSARDLTPIDKQPQHIDWDTQEAQKGGYEHFMLKEIFEQPQVIIDCMTGRVNTETSDVVIPELADTEKPNRLRIVACGTSYHAGLWAMSLIEDWAKIPVTVEIASEFRYRNPILEPGETILAISQSGETADTLAAMRIAKQKGCEVISVCNVIGSTIARESDIVIYTQAGPEISIASTKALTSQMIVLMLFAMHWGGKEGTMLSDARRQVVHGLTALPTQLGQALASMHNKAEKLAAQFIQARGMYFLGRGLSFPMALEGALKMKELTYIHAEGYAAGEIKHGPIALVDADFPSFMLIPHDELFLKSKSNLEEIQARGGPVIAITNPPKDGLEINSDIQWIVPDAWGPLNSFLLLATLQLLSYEMARQLGRDVDHPRNLAKSVTVE